MKVLVLTTTFPRWENDTTPAFVYELSKKLQEKGMDIVVLAPHYRGARRFEIMGGMKVYRFPYFYPTKYQRLAYDGGILPNLKRSNLAKIQVPLLFLSELYYAFKLIRKEKIDVVHSHWIIPNGLVGAICRKILGVKHVLTEHAAGLAALEKIPLKRKIANFIFKNSDKITVVSSYINSRLLNLIPHEKQAVVKNKISVIPMGVDTSIFRQEINKEELKIKYGIKSENVLLFIGRLAEKKGVQYLIKAMPKILDSYPNTELIICGDGPLRSNLENFVREMGLKKHVRFVGYISEREKIDYLSLADILVVPSIVTQSGDTEGLPVVILEGLAAGKAVVASDVGGIKDAIKDGYNGFLIEQRNPNKIAEKVIELFKNEKLREEITNNAFNSIIEYDWNVISKKYEQVLKSLKI